VTAGQIAAGTVITANMLTTKRPGTGIPARELGGVVGRRTARDLESNHMLETADLV
jgi:sialic acid synthase SpsE